MNENKKYIIKGLLLALALIVLNKIFIFCSWEYPSNELEIWTIGIAFGITIILFLKTQEIKNLFTIGFVGLGALLFSEFVLLQKTHDWWFPLAIYLIGFVGSIIGTVVAIILTITKVKFNISFKYREVVMESTLKTKLLSYLLISAIGFSYLILPQNAGISVPIFIIIQFVCLYFLLLKKKLILMFIPIFIMALNSFISANPIWRVSNFFVTVGLYSVMALLVNDNFPIKELSVKFITNILETAVTPIKYFDLPFKWCGETNKEHTQTAKRILIGVAISVPCLIFLLMMLSSADQIFANSVSKVLDDVFSLINFNILFKILCGFIAGLYLFGLIYHTYQPKTENTVAAKKKSGDLIILNILLVSILAIYTMFVIIQFRYLFASGGNLPYGLTYTYYARRGFFELLFLTGLNIMLILLTVWLTKDQTGKWQKFTKILCCYLCTVTVILLISSFYRMWLYNADDGLTQLRFLVFGFLIFEAIGLIFTFFYIIKPKFNIIAVYLGIGLTYYLLLNIVPMDSIIAKDQIDRYLDGRGNGIAYTLTLSVDAAPQIVRLLDSHDIHIKESVHNYFERNNRYYDDFIPRWQRWNLSINRASKYGAGEIR